ncbi:MAG: sensor histidine kinase [Solirubrobacteraceae bacterium]
MVARDGSLPPASPGLVERGESFAEVIDDRGRVRDSTRPLGAAPLLRAAELARAREAPAFFDRPSVPGLDEPARMLAVPVRAARRRLVLVVGATRENRAEALRSLRSGLLIGGAAALALASLAGYLLAGSALRPVEAMRRRAERISSTSLEERLPLSPADDEIRRLGATLNDMLARVQAGIEREQALVANASHELRTPLALLKAELELALRHARSREELEQSLREAASETDRMARLADDLLVLASADQGLALRREPVDVDDLLDTVAARFAALAAERGSAVRVARAEPLVVDGDELRLEQALGNLVDNALRHGGGDVELSARAHDGVVELHVRDEGPGFDQAFVPVALDRFTRGSDARGRGGTGLGLAIVDAIARAHGGRAAVGAAPGGGADVSLSVPA